MTDQQPHLQEEGLVRSLHGSLAMVEAVSSDACSHCGAKGACQFLGGERVRAVPAENPVGAQVGDRVLLAAPRRGVLTAGFLVYMVPVLALIAGAALGQRLGPDWSLGAQGGSVLLGVVSLVVTWLVLRRVSLRLGRNASFKVKIVRVLRKGNADAVEQCAAGL